jgi:aminoglycoside phosphotransferase (APT) family kinase protein
MDQNRKNPIKQIDIETAQKLIKEFDKDFLINQISLSNQGRSTSNYILHQKNSHEKLLLRILPQNDISCRKEMGLFFLLNDYIPIPEIYYTNETCQIIDKPYQIVEFIQGITLAEHLLQGIPVPDQLISDIAEKSALLHRTVYEHEGSLNAQLEIIEELPPISTWHQFFLSKLAGERLGTDLKKKLQNFLSMHKSLFDEICQYFVLSHGDFRPDNILVLDGKLQAMIDWENALSAPLYFDIGQFFRYAELLPKKAERIFAQSYNACAIKPLDNDWKLKSRLMDSVNLLCLLELPHISTDWQNELIRKIRETIDSSHQ